MKTKIFCASLYMAQPFVREVEWTEFVLLFSDAQGIVGVRQQWSPVDDELKVDLALLFRFCNEPNNLDRRWATSIHTESPVSSVERSSLLFRDGEWPTGRPVRRPHVAWFVHSGDVTRFRTCQPLMYDKTFQLRLSISDGRPDIPLSKEMMDVLPRILGNLPTTDLVETIPLVSEQFFAVVKNDTHCWKKIQFGDCLPCLDDLKFICEVAREECTEVSWMTRRSLPYRDIRHNASTIRHEFILVFSETHWPQVKKLVLVGTLQGFEASVLTMGLKKRNFPLLETIKCLMPKLHPLTWRVLADTNLPSLKEVALRVDSSGPPRRHGVTHSGFQTIEALCLYASCKAAESGIQDLVKGNCLPKLQKLSLMGNFDLQREFEGNFSDTGVKHLVIQRKRVTSNYYGFRANAVLERFGDLDALDLVHCYWTAVGNSPGKQRRQRDSAEEDRSAEGNIPNQAFYRVLRTILLPELGKVEDDVPFAQMRNLEVAWVGLNRKMCSSGSVAHLLTLKRLRALRLDVPRGLMLEDVVRGLAMDKSMKKRAPVEDRPLQVLELIWNQRLDRTAARKVGKILKAFPNVIRVSLTCTRFDAMDLLGQVISHMAKIAQLQISWTPAISCDRRVFEEQVRDKHEQFVQACGQDWAITETTFGPGELVSLHFECATKLEGWRQKANPFQTPALLPWAPTGRRFFFDDLLPFPFLKSSKGIIESSMEGGGSSTETSESSTETSESSTETSESSDESDD